MMQNYHQSQLVSKNKTKSGVFLVELYEGKHEKAYPSGSHIAVEHGDANWPLDQVLPMFLAAMAAAAAVTPKE